MTVRSTLLSAFGASFLACLCISGLSVKALSDSNSRFQNYVDGVQAQSDTTHQLQEAIEARAVAVRNLVLVTTPEDLAVEKTAVLQAHKDVGTLLVRLGKLMQVDNVNPASRQAAVEIDKIEQSYNPVALKIVEMALAGQTADAIARMNNECRPLLAALTRATAALTENLHAQTKEVLKENDKAYALQLYLVMAICGIAMVGTLYFGLRIPYRLGRSLGAEPSELRAMARKIANGQLDTPVSAANVRSGSVMEAMARMQTSLAQVIESVRQGSENLSLASTRIAQGNQDLSARTEQQASALEQTASSMEQLNATVKQNTESARQANQLAQSASTIAIKGGEIVGEVVDTMKGINESSQKISDIISVIDGIAFQTNILALNAAVEAARAGEQGRGFAVVASEVRSLAGRSSDAAKEIKQLITTSVQRVGQGTALVDAAGSTMTELVQSIRQVADIMGEINAASMEQSSGVMQIGQAVSRLDKTTQQNSSLVDEMALAANNLNTQAQELVGTVAVFKHA